MERLDQRRRLVLKRPGVMKEMMMKNEEFSVLKQMQMNDLTSGHDLIILKNCF